MFENGNRSIALLPLIAAMASVGCYGGEDVEGPTEHTGSLIAEVNVSKGKRIVFVDEGDGNVGVAEISTMGEAPLVAPMIQREHATPLEIFLATALASEDAPELLVENHRELAALQGREDLEPRSRASLQSLLGTMAAIVSTGVTPCDESGWEDPGGIWGNQPEGNWDAQFHNVTSEYNGTTTYPKAKTITQLAAWNGGSGSYHTHGACISSDAGADNKITFVMKVNNVQVHTDDLFENVGNDDWITYTDYVSTGTVTRSEITNAGNSAATFRHSAGAWVPFPG